MTWFMIRFEGEGLHAEANLKVSLLWGLLKVNRKSTIAGFYTTRYVEAKDADAAIASASLLVRAELAEALLNSPNHNDELVLKVDDILTVDPWEVNANARGFTFFSTHN